MNEKPKRKLGWRLLRWGLIGLAVLLTIVAALVTEENWRGKHAWENFKREAEARGERFDWQSFTPPSVADDQNFFCASIVAEALNQFQGASGAESKETNYRMKFDLYRGDSENWPKHGGNWQKGTLTDLSEWQIYFRKYSQSPQGATNGFPVGAQLQTPAADVLLALSVFNPAIEELRQASLRPAAWLPLNYENGFEDVAKLLPWLAQEKRCANLLQLRTLAELQDNQSELAMQNEKLLLRLIDTIRTQPFLISHLVRVAMQAIALQPIYEGLAQHRWNDEQLADLETALAAKDYLADFQFAMRGEQTCAIATFENWRRTREMTSFTEADGVNAVVTNSMRWMPKAFFYQNELTFAQMHQQFVEPILDLTNRTVSPSALNKIEAELSRQAKHYSIYKTLARMAFPGAGKSVQKFALIQTQVDLARVACALERYRLAHNEYPELIEALAPQFISQVPHDIINGLPLHYRRETDGRFILYSIGWNETDDGGQVVLTKGGSVDREKGDWVWQYPAK